MRRTDRRSRPDFERDSTRPGQSPHTVEQIPFLHGSSSLPVPKRVRSMHNPDSIKQKPNRAPAQGRQARFRIDYLLTSQRGSIRTDSNNSKQDLNGSRTERAEHTEEDGLRSRSCAGPNHGSALRSLPIEADVCTSHRVQMEKLRDAFYYDLHPHTKSKECDHLIDDDRTVAAQSAHDPMPLRKK